MIANHQESQSLTLKTISGRNRRRETLGGQPLTYMKPREARVSRPRMLAPMSSIIVDFVRYLGIPRIVGVEVFP